MSERVVSFGPHGRLSGVFTEPTFVPRTRGARPALLLWTVGTNHHVGPYRFNVDLARHVASRGFASLRFDISGRGDSEVRRDPLGEMERALDDLREAAAVVARRAGHEALVPIGFCSSVDPAHRLALLDDRVVGACFIEGYSFPTLGFYARYPLRLLDPARWRRAVARNIPDALRGLPYVRRLGHIPLSIAEDDAVYIREYPTPDQLRRDYAAMNRRGKHLLFIYVGKDRNYNHRDQLFTFAGTPGLERVEVDYYPRADHTCFLTEDRLHTVLRIGRWVEAKWASG
jgi:hypothetical protein